MRVIVLAVLLCLLFPCPNVTAESDFSEQSEASGISEIEGYYSENIRPYLKEHGMDFDLRKTIEGIWSGEFELSVEGVFECVIEIIFGGIKKNITLAVCMLLIACFCGFLSNLSVFGRNCGEAAFYVCFCVICGVCAMSFSYAVQRSAEVILMISDFVKVAAIPLATLCMASGGFGTASILSPILYAASAFSVEGVKAFVLPLAYGAFALNAVGCMDDGIDLSRSVTLLKNLSKNAMVFFMTIFSGLSVICNVAGGAVNALTGKTVKLAVGSFIPVVGGMLADSIEMVAACTGVVKRSAGAGALCVILLIFISCAAELMVYTLLLRVTAAVSSLLCGGKIVRLLEGTADCISIIFAALCICSFLFLIIITFMICGVTM